VNVWDTLPLVVPVAHIWYFRSLPNKIGYLLGLPTKKLDMIIYYERYVVLMRVRPMLKRQLLIYDFLTEEEYFDILRNFQKKINTWMKTDPKQIHS
jgi:DNA-directed RNA polymerase subunit beta'